MELIDIHRRVVASPYKPWQVYFLAVAGIAGTGVYFEVGVVMEMVQAAELFVTGWEWLVMLSIQGVLTGIAAELLYEQGDGYAKTLSTLFGSKDRTLLVRVGVMTGVVAVITHLVPSIVGQATTYPVLQTTGAIISLGIIMIHLGSTDWNPSTEWPALLAGAILALAPSLA